jgi:hypothetical protein
VSSTNWPNSRLLVRDGGLKILDLDQSLADEHDLVDFGVASYPGVVDELQAMTAPEAGYRYIGEAGLAI